MQNSIYSTVNIFWMANGWFEAGDFDIKYAPVHAAFVAYVRGERLPARRQSGSPPPGSGFLRQAEGAEAACRWGAGWQGEAEASAEAKSVSSAFI